MGSTSDPPGLRLRRAASLGMGWLADRRVPGPLRGATYRTFARCIGADPSEAELPLAGYPSLGAFFVRRLRPGSRPLDPSPDRILSPSDGHVQAIDRIEEGSLLQAKGRPYAVDELLAGALADGDLDPAGAWAITIYLGPRDYHRVHTPLACELEEVRWVDGDRLSVAPKVLERHEKVLSINERAVMRLGSERGTAFLVMVGALNVGRIRVLGVEPGTSPSAPVPFERGAELARFEMGSTVVLILPRDAAEPVAGLAPGAPVRQGQALAELLD